MKVKSKLAAVASSKNRALQGLNIALSSKSYFRTWVTVVFYSVGHAHYKSGVSS